jgi:O-antigen/teichoic acid export membrane protein
MNVSFARRFGLGVADQILSSLTNFAVSFFVARSAGTVGLGVFGLAFATYTIVLGISRALNTEPLVVRHSTASLAEWREATAAATGAALGLGVIVGVGCLLAGVALDGTASSVFLALAIGFPGLLLQDSWRWAFVASGRAGLAATNDLVWAVVMLPTVALLVGTGRASSATVTLAWVGAASVAAFLGLAQARIVPRPGQMTSWWRRNRDLGSRYLIEFLVGGVATELVFYAVGGIAGIVAVGSLRAAWLILAPLNIVLMGLMLVSVPEGARLLRESVTRLERACVRISAFLMLCVLGWGGVTFVIPASWGRRFLGETWTAGHRLLLPIIVYTLASALSNGAWIGLRALQSARRGLAARVVNGPLVISAGVVGAWVAGDRGAAWGMAAGNVVGAAVWWHQFAAGVAELRALRSIPRQ